MAACSDTDSGVGDGEGLLEGVVGVSSDEILEEQLAVSEVAGVVLEGLSVSPHQGLLEVGGEPDPLFHVLTAEEVLALLDELVGAHLHVLIEEVAAEDLLSVSVVQHVGGHEEEAEGALGHELHVLVVEEDVVVVQEQELYTGGN